MTLSALGIFSAAGAGVVSAGSYELIESQILGSSQTSITFSSLGTYSSTYKHLQIRLTARSSVVATSTNLRIRLNGDSGTNYNYHGLYGNGTSVAAFSAANATDIYAVEIETASTGANQFSAAVVDLLDVYSTTKNKTIKSLNRSQGPIIGLFSSAWRNTASVTSIELSPAAGNLIAGSRFSLYGIKG